MVFQLCNAQCAQIPKLEHALDSSSQRQEPWALVSSKLRPYALASSRRMFCGAA